MWANWGDFTPCSVSCGRGTRLRRRDCDLEASCGDPDDSLQTIDCIVGVSYLKKTSEFVYLSK